MSRFEKFFVNRRGPRAYRRMLERMESAGELRLPPAAQVLELGAGNGALSALIAERFHPAKICLTDYDPEQLVVAKKHLESYFGTIPPSIVVERADGAQLDYADATFDLVMAHQVLHHLGSIERMYEGLDEIARVLRPGGRLLYVEMFHKRVIRERLVERGFTLVFRERAWRIFNPADVVIAERPSPNTLLKIDRQTVREPASPIPSHHAVPRPDHLDDESVRPNSGAVLKFRLDRYGPGCRGSPRSRYR
jgi:ubiquinone/menaquinone biosynthesis C-methylase UbiE